MDTALRLSDAAKQGYTEASRDTVQLQQCINSSRFSFLWQTHWPVPKADGGYITAVNYSGVLLICKSVLPWKQLCLFSVFCWYWANDSGCYQVNNFRGEKKDNHTTFKQCGFVNLLGWWQQSEPLCVHFMVECVYICYSIQSHKCSVLQRWIWIWNVLCNQNVFFFCALL